MSVLVEMKDFVPNVRFETIEQKDRKWTLVLYSGTAKKVKISNLTLDTCYKQLKKALELRATWEKLHDLGKSS
jgi:hypothetical protein